MSRLFERWTAHLSEFEATGFEQFAFIQRPEKPPVSEEPEANTSGDIPGDNTSTTSIAVDTPVDGIFENSGDSDWYRYEGEAGEIVTITVTYGDDIQEEEIDGILFPLNPPALFVYDANGSQLSEEFAVDYPTDRQSVLSFELPADGVYFLAADTAHAGTYTISLQVGRDLPADATTPALIEMGGSLIVDFNDFDDTDWIAFDAPANSVLRFTINDLVSSSDFEIVDASGAVVGNSQFLQGRDSTTIYVSDLDAERYYVSVTGDSGAAELTAQIQPDDFSDAEEGAGALATGGTLSGQLEYALDTDWLAFNLTAGERYVLFLDSPSNLESETQIDLLLDGAPVAASITSSDFSLFGDRLTLVIEPDVSGTYHLQISSDVFNGFQPLSYEASLEVINDQPADTSTEAVVFRNGTLGGGTFEDQSDRDWFRLDLERPQTVTFNIALDDENADPSNLVISVYDADGSWLANLSSVFRSNEMVQNHFGEAGTYFLEVSYSGTQSLVDYSVSAETVSNGTPGLVSTQDNLLPSLLQFMNVDRPVFGSEVLENGSVFTFQTISFDNNADIMAGRVWNPSAPDEPIAEFELLPGRSLDGFNFPPIVQALDSGFAILFAENFNGGAQIDLSVAIYSDSGEFLSVTLLAQLVGVNLSSYDIVVNAATGNLSIVAVGGADNASELRYAEVTPQGETLFQEVIATSTNAFGRINLTALSSGEDIVTFENQPAEASAYLISPSSTAPSFTALSGHVHGEAIEHPNGYAMLVRDGNGVESPELIVHDTNGNPVSSATILQVPEGSQVTDLIVLDDGSLVVGFIPVGGQLTVQRLGSDGTAIGDALVPNHSNAAGDINLHVVDGTSFGIESLSYLSSPGNGTQVFSTFDIFSTTAPLPDPNLYRLSEASDVLSFSDGDEVIEAGDGNDIINAGGGRDRVDGGAGRDSLSGEAGNDTLIGGDGQSLSSAEAQVFRLYQATLDRAPDAAGLAGWANQIEGGRAFLEIVAGFVNSNEFQSVYGDLDDEAFINLLYNNVLGRNADPAGLQGWLNQLENGSSRESVVRGFSDSQEFIGRTDLATQAWATDVKLGDVEGQIFRLYQATLGRSPDPGGFQGWISQIEGGRAYTDIVPGFVNSNEFQSQYGNLSDEAFIDLLYNNVLGRDADPAGLQGWLNRLENGSSRESVVRGFAESPEFIGRTADSLEAFMRASNGNWQDTLEGGAGNDSLFGGRGADTFVFDATDTGTDTVHGFEAWDTIEMNGFGYASSAEFAARLREDGNDVVFSDGGVTVRFTNSDIDMVTRAYEGGTSAEAPGDKVPVSEVAGADHDSFDFRGLEGLVGVSPSEGALQVEFGIIAPARILDVQVSDIDTAYDNVSFNPDDVNILFHENGWQILS